MYAATAGGVFRSIDGGAIWVAEGVPPTNIRDLAIDENADKVYAAVEGTGVFATFDSFEAPPVPTLSLDFSEYCIGQPWTLQVRGAQADSFIRLVGVSNSQAWEIATWNRTDGSGRYDERGTFSAASEGRHTLYVEIDGASSNDVSFRVSDCRLSK